MKINVKLTTTRKKRIPVIDLSAWRKYILDKIPMGKRHGPGK